MTDIEFYVGKGVETSSSKSFNLLENFANSI